MIGLVRMPFFKRENVFDGVHMTEIGLYLLKDEKIDKELPMFVSGDVVAIFTDKRMVFVRKPEKVNGFEKAFEMEFLPYKSIQRFSMLKSNIEKAYNIYVNVSENLEFSFCLEDLNEARKIMELIGGKSI